jgi:Cyclic nucleotide-binding domain
LPGAAAATALGLQRWIGLPAARAHCVCHFLGIAATLAAAKVLLSTIAVTLFVAEQGAAGLPPFYIAFAALALVLSFGLSAIIDRAAKVRLAQVTFAGLLLGTAALRLLLAFEVQGVGFALLASATAFEIILDIVFWVVVAAYLDAFEFRRATPLVYMALALGGAAGGVVARVGAGYLAPADLLLLLPPLAALVVAQFGAVARRLDEIPEHHPDTEGEANAGLGPLRLVRLLRRYPLALLIALNALVVTLLYGLSEFLILSFYGERFASEAELAEFLSLLFALMQVVEFGLLYTVTRLLLERTGPLLRNLVFPLTSLASLVFLVGSPRLLAVVLVHINIEAASNAIFLPIGNANYVPLPLGFQGRARTLAEGIFYPIGLALAGGVLWTAAPDAAWLEVEFAALVFAALFALLSAGIGLLFLPTLRANVGAGLLTPGATIAADPLPAARVRALLHSREPELRRLGLALAQHDPGALENDLLSLAARPDQATRTALARLVATAPRPWAARFIDHCLAGSSAEQAKLALLVLLRRRARLRPEQLAQLEQAPDPAVPALARLVADGDAAWAVIAPLTGPQVAAELVAAIVAAERADLHRVLVACLAAVAPEQQGRALAMLNSAAWRPDAVARDLLRPLAQRGSAAVRAEAIVLLSRAAPRAAALRGLLDALADPDRHVRRRAGAALAEHGDRALALLRRRFHDLTMASVDGAWAAARIASPRARPLLAAYVQALQQDAERTAQLLERIAAAPDRARFAALELCLADHRARLVDVIMAIVSPAIEARLERRVRDALQSADQRSRASAFELLVAVPASRLTPGAVALLRYLLFEDAGHTAGGDAGLAELRRQAMASTSPWVRRAAARLAAPVARDRKGDHAMALQEQELERVVALKGMPLFRYIPIETVLEVARAAQPRTYLAGEQVIADTTGRQELLILESGTLAIERQGGAGTLAAPACLGEAALVGEPMPWPKLTALADCRVWFLRAAQFQELCQAHPEMAIELCRLLARRVREANGAPPPG